MRSRARGSIADEDLPLKRPKAGTRSRHRITGTGPSHSDVIVTVPSRARCCLVDLARLTRFGLSYQRYGFSAADVPTQFTAIWKRWSPQPKAFPEGSRQTARTQSPFTVHPMRFHCFRRPVTQQWHKRARLGGLSSRGGSRRLRVAGQGLDRRVT